jgi:5'-nucleotidase
VLDPALGDGVPLGNAQKTVMLTASNGIKVGVIGLAEREWLDTINSLPPDIIYKSASATAKELIPGLKEQGAEIIVCVSHQREPNDNKLAEKTGGDLIDIILGGHDHYYSYSHINGTHVLRSGTDFKQLSHVEAWRKPEGKGWDFKITRRDIVSSIKEDPTAMALVDEQTQEIRKRLDKPIGYTAAPLDARFTTVRTKESNIGNFVCDLMRYYYNTECCIMAAGTIRGYVKSPHIITFKRADNSQGSNICSRRAEATRHHQLLSLRRPGCCIAGHWKGNLRCAGERREQLPSAGRTIPTSLKHQLRGGLLEAAALKNQ